MELPTFQHLRFKHYTNGDSNATSMEFLGYIKGAFKTTLVGLPTVHHWKVKRYLNVTSRITPMELSELH